MMRAADTLCGAIDYSAALYTDNLIYGCAFLFVALTAWWHFWHPAK